VYIYYRADKRYKTFSTLEEKSKYDIAITLEDFTTGSPYKYKIS